MALLESIPTASTKEKLLENPFLESPLKVKLINAFASPFKNAIATARTCYSSKGIITDEGVSMEKHAALAKSIYEAGHHTTLQHAHFQFAIEQVSRHAIWSFLHSHPFYNSEQVSQRYVEVKPGNVIFPELPEAAAEVYRGCVEDQMATYQRLIALLIPKVAEEFFRIFPARKR